MFGIRSPSLHSIIEEEIDKDSIYLSSWIQLQDLSANEFDAPDTATSQLDLPRFSGGQFFERLDVRTQRWAVLYTSEAMQHLGDAIICVCEFFCR
jgi:hypothetical protein